jgi:hypothetical protein
MYDFVCLSQLGPRQVIVMDQSGRHEKVYEFDNRKKPLFTNPRRITTDSNNNLYVLDRTCGGSKAT